MNHQPDIEHIAQWVGIHLGGRKGIPEPQLMEFVDHATPKVIVFFDLEDKPITEQAIKRNYPALMRFIQLHDNDIEVLIEQKDAGVYESQMLARGSKKKNKSTGWLEHILLPIIFLMVAYKLGKGFFTFAVIAMGIFYTYLFIDEKEHVHLQLRRRRGSVQHEAGE